MKLNSAAPAFFNRVIKFPTSTTTDFSQNEQLTSVALRRRVTKRESNNDDLINLQLKSK